jgi:hypothetical protein
LARTGKKRTDFLIPLEGKQTMLTVDQKLDFDALLPAAPQAGSRRSALKLALGAGYAAAAGPLMAQTAIKTSSEGLRTGESSFELNGFKVPVFFAAPAGKSNLPVVLVIHEVFGVHEYIADTCRRFARAGYMAVAPELFARQGDPGEYGELAKLMTEIVNKTSDAQVMADLDGAVAWAAGQGGDAQKVAITGSTAPASKPAWPGTGAWWVSPVPTPLCTRYSRRPCSKRRCWACMVVTTAAFRWIPSTR